LLFNTYEQWRYNERQRKEHKTRGLKSDDDERRKSVTALNNSVNPNDESMRESNPGDNI
jgi:hypothetical protein